MRIAGMFKNLALRVPSIRRVRERIVYLRSELAAAQAAASVADRRADTCAGDLAIAREALVDAGAANALVQARLEKAEDHAAALTARLEEAAEQTDELARQSDSVRASLRLRIYVLTSDHQRAVASLDRLRSQRASIPTDAATATDRPGFSGQDT